MGDERWDPRVGGDTPEGFPLDQSPDQDDPSAPRIHSVDGAAHIVSEAPPPPSRGVVWHRNVEPDARPWPEQTSYDVAITRFDDAGGHPTPPMPTPPAAVPPPSWPEVPDLGAAAPPAGHHEVPAELARHTEPGWDPSPSAVVEVPVAPHPEGATVALAPSGWDVVPTSDPATTTSSPATGWGWSEPVPQPTAPAAGPATTWGWHDPPPSSAVAGGAPPPPGFEAAPSGVAGADDTRPAGADAAVGPGVLAPPAAADPRRAPFVLVGSAVVIAVGCVVGFLVTEADTADVGAQPSASVSTTEPGSPSSTGAGGDGATGDPTSPDDPDGTTTTAGPGGPADDDGSDAPRAVGPFRIGSGRVALEPEAGQEDLLIWNDSGDELAWDVEVAAGAAVRVDPGSGRLGARQVTFARISTTGPEGGTFRLTPRGNGERSYTIVVSEP